GRSGPSVVGFTTGFFSNIMIDWGDGTAPTPGTIPPDPPGSSHTMEFPRRYAIVGTHAYAQPGTYNVTITASPLIFAARPLRSIVLGESLVTASDLTSAPLVAHSTAIVAQNS